MARLNSLRNMTASDKPSCVVLVPADTVGGISEIIAANMGLDTLLEPASQQQHKINTFRNKRKAFLNKLKAFFDVFEKQCPSF
mgnify:CR=1 FL=1